MHFQLHNQDLFEKVRKTLNTKQCPAGLYPRIILHVYSFLPKMSPALMLLCCPNQVSPRSPERL